MMKKTSIILFFLIRGLINGQELMNFYLEPNANNNSVTLHTTVFRSMETIYQTITTQTNGNEIDVLICYSNSAGALITFDHQEFPISLPLGFSSFIINVKLFGDDDGFPCELKYLVDFGSKSFDFPYTPSETTSIPDDNFEYYLENTFSGDDIPNNNLVFTHRIENIGKLILNNQLIIVNPIESIIGIEYIPRLKYLFCEQNPISSINVSANLNLIELTCGNNLINTIDVSNNLFLKRLWCGFVFLTDLDVANNLLLEDFFFSGDGLTQIDLSHNSNLKYLSFNSNDLTGINLSGNLNLITLGIGGTSQIVDLNLSNNLLLEELSLSNTLIVTLNLISNTDLIKLDCEGGVLASLDVTGLINLNDVFCVDNQLINLNLSTNTGLEKVHLIQNNLTSLNIKNGNNSNITALVTIANNNLYCIDVDNENEAPYPGWIVDSQTVFSEDCSLGITESELANSISIFPNPFKDILHLQAQNDLFINSISIYDILGRLIYRDAENVSQIDMSHLNRGLYFINIETSKGSLAKKVVKE